MNIHAERGAKVRYTGEAGYDIDHAIAGKSGLKVGGVYTVDFAAVGRDRTEVYLEEVKGVGFNSVIFEDVPGEEPRLDKDAHGRLFQPEPEAASAEIARLAAELAESEKHFKNASCNCELWHNIAIQQGKECGKLSAELAEAHMRARDSTQKYPVLVVCAVIICDGKVLMERRAPKGVIGLDRMWDLPGGKVERGETPEAAIIRKIQEELGVTVKPIALIPHLHTSEWTYAEGDKHAWILAPYICEIVSGEPTLGESLQWFPANALGSDVLEVDTSIVQEALELTEDRWKLELDLPRPTGSWS